MPLLLRTIQAMNFLFLTARFNFVSTEPIEPFSVYAISKNKEEDTKGQHIYNPTKVEKFDSQIWIFDVKYVWRYCSVYAWNVDAIAVGK